jgi:asparagine synthase (glutamine-hydrolysing)
VVLAGEGADECFAGYAFCQGALGAGDRLDRVHGVLNLLRRDTAPERLIRKASPWLARAVRFQGLSPEWLDPLADQLTRVRSLLAPERANADADLFGSCFARIASGNQLRDRAPVHRLLYLWMKSVFANYILGAERMDMAHAVEVRLPFLDSGVFDFARRLPASVLARGPMEKHILRLAAHPAIGACAERPKQPFYVPFSGFGRSHPLYSMAQDTLRSDLPSRVPFLEPHAGVRLADRIATGDGPSPADGPVDATVLMLLSVCILQQRYGLS